MGESRNAYRVLVGRPEGKRPLERPRRRGEDNIAMDLREVGYDDRDWIGLAQDMDRWRAYVRAAMNLRHLVSLPELDLRYNAESVKIYQATHESNEDPEDYDRPLQVRYWPHPADRITIGEVKNSFTYAVEIYTDGSKIQEKVGAAAF
ncbi:hypothetical protein ANN_02271 [Periplaneta americana]|uniref:Uncharacterized protein n=1 Tax=Periplaneta americana TaxID=6978 RepID=A0ABQ8U010_PERAM|nr:hypothetical protein ANN_02271 [Periplaneta americana]